MGIQKPEHSEIHTAEMYGKGEGNRKNDGAGSHEKKDSGQSSRRIKSSASGSAWVLAAGALFCCGLWGSAPPFIKFGYELLRIQSTASILLFAGLRFLLSGILVILAGSFMGTASQTDRADSVPKDTTGKTAEISGTGQNHQKGFSFMKPDPRAFKAICILAFFQTFGQYLFYYLGLALTSSVMGSVLSGTSAFIALLLSAYVFHREKGTAGKLTGCMLGFLGILVMNMQGLSFHFGAGEMLLLASQVCSATSAVFLQIFGQKYNPVMLSGYQFTLGGLILSLTGLCMGGSISWNVPGAAVLFWLALVSAGAYTLWGILLKSWPVSAVSIYSCTIPIFGVLFSWLILHESQAFSWQTLAALVLIVAGVYMLNSHAARKEARRQESA